MRMHAVVVTVGLAGLAALAACGTLLDISPEPAPVVAVDAAGDEGASPLDADVLREDAAPDGGDAATACAPVDDPCDADSTCCGSAQCDNAKCRTCSLEGGSCSAGDGVCCGSLYCNHSAGYVCRPCSGEGGPCGIIGPSGCCAGLTCGGPSDAFCR